LKLLIDFYFIIINKYFHFFWQLFCILTLKSIIVWDKSRKLNFVNSFTPFEFDQIVSFLNQNRIIWDKARYSIWESDSLVWTFSDISNYSSLRNFQWEIQISPSLIPDSLSSLRQNLLTIEWKASQCIFSAFKELIVWNYLVILLQVENLNLHCFWPSNFLKKDDQILGIDW
jgi:hypothetical protein